MLGKDWLRVFRFEWKKIWKYKIQLIITFISILVFVFIYGVVVVMLTDRDEAANEPSVYVIDEEVDDAFSEAMRLIGVSCIYCPGDTVEEIMMREYFADNSVIVSMQESKVFYYESNSTSRQLTRIVDEYVRQEYIQQNNEGCKDLFDRISVNDVSDRRSSLTRVVAYMLPYLLLPLLYSAAASRLIECIAGERSRGTFALTLLSPISSKDLVFGKMLFGVSYSVLNCVVYFIVFVLKDYVLLRIGHPEAMTFVGVRISPAVVAFLVCYVLLVSVFFAMLACAIAFRAGSFRSAKNLNSFVNAGLLILGFYSVLNVSEKSWVDYLVPVYNACIFIQDIVNENVHLGGMICILLSTLACIVVSCVISIRSVNSESIAF